MLPVQLNNEQTDPATVSVGNERQSQKMQWAMENLEFVSKILENSSTIFTQKLIEKKILAEIFSA